MTDAIRNEDRKLQRPRLLAAALALGVATLAFGAAPADAGGEFKNGFEDELGRIVAHHVAAVGHAVFAAPFVVHSAVHHGPPRYRPLPPPVPYYADVPRGRGHRHHAHGRGHAHHRGCRHAGRPTQVTVIREYGHHGRGHRAGRHHR